MELAAVYCTQPDNARGIGFGNETRSRGPRGKAKESGISAWPDYNKVEIYKRAARNFNGDYRTTFYVYTGGTTAGMS